MLKQLIGVVGMSVMGRNLALNLERHGYRVSIFNRSRDKTDKVIAKHPEKNLIPYYTLKTFADSLKKPRCILLMVKAGPDTDQIIELFRPYLEKGDTLIDGGNTFYKDTIRRNRELLASGLNLIGAGISGGEEGALKGASIMPGGDKKAYELVAPILKKIAACSDGESCIAYIGPDASGHYVKMVHNGIEYGDMQLISEAYALLRIALKLNNEELAYTFSEWNKGELNSYLLDITKDIFTKKDDQNNYIIDTILDEASSKGTGKWASQSALDLGEPLNLITESVFARYLSSIKDQRIVASKLLSGPKIRLFSGKKRIFIEKIRRALYLGKIIAYTQGFSQLKIASEKNNWKLNYFEIAKIFRAGCIIRAQILQKIANTYAKNPEIVNLLLSPEFKKVADIYQKSLRDVSIYAVRNGIPIPAFFAAISYYDSYRSVILPANLIQAQRDYFGAHTYKRTDKDGIFHTKWLY